MEVTLEPVLPSAWAVWVSVRGGGGGGVDRVDVRSSVYLSVYLSVDVTVDTMVDGLKHSPSPWRGLLLGGSYALLIGMAGIQWMEVDEMEWIDERRVAMGVWMAGKSGSWTVRGWWMLSAADDDVVTVSTVEMHAESTKASVEAWRLWEVTSLASI